MIELQNVSKYYGTFKAIDDVSFSVKTGEIVGLLGPNGAGKTTIMKMITGYHNAHAGTIRVCDIDVMNDAVQAKQHIGYLPENNPLYDDLLVYEYLQFIGLSRGISDGDVDKAIESVVKQCSLGEFLYKPISSLSKGMCQRVGLAQAIIHNPDVVILDEPTSGLDPNQIKDIREVIRELGKIKTVILSTHILQEVEVLCSRIFIVNKGKIVAEGTNAEIAAKLKGEEVYSLTCVGTVEEHALQSLKSIHGIITVMPSDASTSEYTSLSIQGESGILHGEHIFDWAVSNGVRICDLYKKSASLESIFESITSNQSTIPAHAEGGVS